MTIESAVADLTTATNTLTSAVLVQQTNVSAAISTFANTTNRVQTGLNLVSNTSDADKPVSVAQLAVINTKQDILQDGINISTVNGVSLLGGLPLVIARSATSLVSLTYDSRGLLRDTPMVPSIQDDSVVVEGIGILLFVSSQLEPDDDETCFTAALGQWLLSVPAYDLLSAWALIEDSIRDELDEDEFLRFSNYIIKT
jgi:hypothetical protein